MLQLWEILVPCQYNTGKPVRTRHHRQWDKWVMKVTQGMTILAPSKGKWVNKLDAKAYEERMIPVRIACTRQQIEQIIQFSLNHYKQLAMMAYKISDEVIIKYGD